MRLSMLVGLLVLGGCSDLEPCDPGWILQDGLCRPLPAQATDAGVPDATATSADSAASAFGKACSDGVNHTDCASPADRCLVQPGKSVGFCSAIGCDKNPALCPTDWTCFDLSKVQAGAPWGCVKF